MGLYEILILIVAVVVAAVLLAGLMIFMNRRGRGE
jgi:hypothetical protein